MGLSEATQRAVQSLPHEEKEIIVLRFVHGCSFSEIARIIHLPAVSVTRLAYKALQRMREALESWEKVA